MKISWRFYCAMLICCLNIICNLFYSCVCTASCLTAHFVLQMEQIKRANRMYTNDSIFLKKSLSIPVLSDLDHCNSGVDVLSEDSGEDNASSVSAENGCTAVSTEKKQEDGSRSVSDLSPVEFLKRLDGLINQSKQAAVKGCQEAEKRYVCRPLTACLFTLVVMSHAPRLCLQKPQVSILAASVLQFYLQVLIFDIKCNTVFSFLVIDFCKPSHSKHHSFCILLFLVLFLFLATCKISAVFPIFCFHMLFVLQSR